MNELVPAENSLARTAEDFLPVLSIEQAQGRREALVKYVGSLMKEGIDYGKIPGSPKDARPTLLKPGAEKLSSFFGLSPEFELASSVEDWTGEDHGEPLFYYRYKCQLTRNGRVLGSGEGSANSWETKYRYRKGDRLCPQCAAPAIISDGFAKEGGWLCFKKKGGCGAKFPLAYPEIVNQPIGKVKNEDIADLVNTLQKMAQKRALIAATLIATGASEFYTQDMDDVPPGGAAPRPQQAARRSEALEVSFEDISQEEEPLPDPLRMLFARMGNKVSTCREVIAEFKYTLHELTGSDTEYYTVLAHHNVPDKEAWKKVTVGQCRAIVAALHDRMEVVAADLRQAAAEAAEEELAPEEMAAEEPA